MNGFESLDKMTRFATDATEIRDGRTLDALAAAKLFHVAADHGPTYNNTVAEQIPRVRKQALFEIAARAAERQGLTNWEDIGRFVQSYFANEEEQFFASAAPSNP